MGWNIGLAVVEGSSLEDVRTCLLGPGASPEPDIELSLSEATNAEWRDDSTGFGTLGDRVLATGSFLWEREDAWKELSLDGRVLVFFLSENWGGSNVYDVYERGARVRSYREDDGDGKPVFSGKKQKFEPPTATKMHPADRISKSFEALTGAALFSMTTLETRIAIYKP